MAALYELFRPMAWAAAFAFLLGFLGYLVIDPPARDHASTAPASVVSEPQSSAWNFQKQI